LIVLAKTGNIKKMKYKTKILSIVLASYLAIVVFLPTNVLMAAGCTTGSECLNQGKPKQIIELLQVGINILAAIVGVGAVIMIIYGGIRYITSNGNPQSVADAKKTITNVMIGLISFFFLWAFLEWLIPGGIFK
jgi:hypothetical protein